MTDADKNDQQMMRRITGAHPCIGRGTSEWRGWPSTVPSSSVTSSLAAGGSSLLLLSAQVRRKVSVENKVERGGVGG